MADRNDARNLRQWLHRIEEACARADASPELVGIRNAALAALAGKPAPKATCFGSDAHD
ncbi:hypothetical protein [Ancylobacter sp.]|uniref:hypothetical protein n=1 Tax=Ancylobacter sp. TaxID=1872567 RepID=UPI003D0A73DD